MVAGPRGPRRRAQVTGSAGVEPRLRGWNRMIAPLLIAAAGTGYLVRTAWPVPAIPPPAAGVLLAAFAGIAWVYLRRTHRRLDRYVKGARGEETVAQELALLPADYAVFHGLRLPAAEGEPGRADCDHLVVTPRGIAVIETKNWAGPLEIRGGRILVEGLEPDRPPLAQVKRAGAALREALARSGLDGIPVYPILSFASDALPVASQGLDGVLVCRASVLRRVLDDPLAPLVDAAARGHAIACIRPWVHTL